MKTPRDESEQLWLYVTDEKNIYIYFRDRALAMRDICVLKIVATVGVCKDYNLFCIFTLDIGVAWASK